MFLIEFGRKRIGTKDFIKDGRPENWQPDHFLSLLVRTDAGCKSRARSSAWIERLPSKVD